MSPEIRQAILPAEYGAKLKSLSLAPAWLKLGQLVPAGRPVRLAGPVHWSYREARACLTTASELVPIEQAERRVLGLANPGLTSRLATTPSIFGGLQLILPGEHAPSHRHVPAAARLIIEGAGAFTRVNDKDIPMLPGDLVLTPPHHWHSHHFYSGTEPMVWLDILDHPICVPMETSFLSGEQEVDNDQRAEREYRTDHVIPGLAPYRRPSQLAPRYPIWHFPWPKTESALNAVAANRRKDEPVHMMFVNAETGQSLLETMAFSVLMLRPGEEYAAPTRSASTMVSIIGGEGESTVDELHAKWEAGDTLSCPTFAQVVHRNRSGTKPAYLLLVDDSPMQVKLGIYSEEA
ncbi:MAG: inducible gentisate 1,2 dioxygenase [Ramlibacter sp.]|nr:inducible gentisate 1,2 dioxygenase [Ramlibacter sp.]